MNESGVCVACSTTKVACPDPAGIIQDCKAGATEAYEGVTCEACRAGRECSGGSENKCPDGTGGSEYKTASYGSGTCRAANPGSFAPSNAMDQITCPTNLFTFAAN